MKQKKTILLISILLIISFCIGAVSVKLYPKIKEHLVNQAVEWDLIKNSNWSDVFQLVETMSSVDGNVQKSYFLTSSEKKPLLVSLHTWSGDFSQIDPLAKLALKYGWNYIHPDFRGANRTKNSCLSPFVITDIDDVIQFAINNSNVDVENIFIVGASGGGYVTLGSYLKTRHKIKTFLSWVPISDLSAWYFQSLSLSNEQYAKDILACTSLDSKALDVEAAKKRSPIYWEVPPKNNSRLEIFAGINDGHAGGGSVPISHSLLFFNWLVSEYGLNNSQIDDFIFANLLTRGHKTEKNYKKIGDREIIYQNLTPKVSITIFNGGHEMLPEYTFKRLIQISKEN